LAGLASVYTMLIRNSMLEVKTTGQRDSVTTVKWPENGLDLKN